VLSGLNPTVTQTGRAKNWRAMYLKTVLMRSRKRVEKKGSEKGKKGSA
jgi:hypothetical protein